MFDADIATLAHGSDTAIARIEMVLPSFPLDKLLIAGLLEPFGGGLVGLELVLHSCNRILKYLDNVKSSLHPGAMRHPSSGRRGRFSYFFDTSRVADGRVTAGFFGKKSKAVRIAKNDARMRMTPQTLIVPIPSAKKIIIPTTA